MAMLNRRIGVLEKRGRTAAAMPAPAGGGQPLTGQELAERLGITAETVRRWASLGMPSCGTHPARPTWPIYDEAACRTWAGRNQSQTLLRPPSGGGEGAAPPPTPSEELAKLRAQKIFLQAQELRHKIETRRSQLVRADEVRVAAKRHADAVRRRMGQIPARLSGPMIERFGLGADAKERLEAIIAEEMALALEGLRDDPMDSSDVGAR